MHRPSVWGSEKHPSNSAVHSILLASDHHPSLRDNQQSYCQACRDTSVTVELAQEGHYNCSQPLTAQSSFLIRFPWNAGPAQDHTAESPLAQTRDPALPQPSTSVTATPHHKGSDLLWVSWRLKTLSIPSGDSTNT